MKHIFLSIICLCLFSCSKKKVDQPEAKNPINKEAPQPAKEEPKDAATEKEGPVDKDKEAGADKEAKVPEKAKTFKSLVDQSTRLESLASLDRGRLYLLESQKKNGSWSDHPGITAMACVALLNERAGIDQAVFEKAFDFIRSKISKKGAVQYKAEEDLYSSAVCLYALLIDNKKEDAEQINKLSGYLVRSTQSSGFSYAAAKDSDLSNTHWAIEAIALQETRDSKSKQNPIFWKKIRAFVKSCQLESGAFTYYPVDKRPENPEHPELVQKEIASLSLGALKSLNHASAKKDSVEIKKGFDWFNKNFSVKENSGLKDGGLYYYYYMLSSTMNKYTVKYINKSNWRKQLLIELLGKQKGDGNWVNQNKLWLENDPVLCTSYAIIAMEIALW
ncbi:MAG: terpene cyclase/mutase family protein [Lentisphaeria bacterium]|nr:terpene cyclase/mutase family protein [Lentisphaeria bacterium]NQZ66877.1 terpene cyclase/mutase family protein [Lentisphaeria bacterium]